jgi:hypothetical protein
MANSLNDGNQQVVVYFHGSGGTRASRGAVLNVIAGMDLHVLAIDYRGGQ